MVSAEMALIDTTGVHDLLPKPATVTAAESPSTAVVIAGSPLNLKKRTCEETVSSHLSTKKTKETESADDGMEPGASDSTDTSDTGPAERREGKEHGTDAGDKEGAQLPLHTIHYGQVTDNDVLLDSRFEDRPGNKKYRALLESKKALYQESKRQCKSLIVMDIINEWRAQDPPGRFLKFEFGSIKVLGDEVTRAKISTTLGKGSRPRKKKQRDSNESNGTIVTLSDEEKPNGEQKGVKAVVHNTKIDGDSSNRDATTVHPKKVVPPSRKENVRPYGHTSTYNDVLSFFASNPFDADSMRYLHALKGRKSAKESLIRISRASLPIVPQKEFVISKAPSSEAMQSCQGSLRSPNAVKKEVSKFLSEEAKYLEVKAVSVLSNHSLSALKKARASKKGAGGKSKHAETRKNSQGTSNLVPRKVTVPNDSKKAIAKGVHAVVSNPSIPSDPHVVAVHQEQEVTDPKATPKITMASTDINASKTTAAAKVPIASGSHLDDKNASKHAAQAAPTKQVSEGTLAAKPKGPRISFDGKPIGAGCKAPKTPKTPRSSSTKSGTPKTPKTPAILLFSEAAPNLPKGWTTKTFQRTSGKTAGHRDMYFYSPQREIKFRSMKGCLSFVKILSEAGVDGNESIALKLYKERGHRF
eukprot:CAMPEP_0183729786 /NCGR_PEP_ID=MMETSP0737-20130205/31195_1 /TAXON_ID=385413 /ORGANISM="Thalassiosira miniscula, Strain CCMP1093" /LENGTH=641 /DNA_ID=CAMNT_0025962075 /DNA_START=81 /DNA_END=2006 /DNA_ORIENTATION=+